MKKLIFILSFIFISLICGGQAKDIIQHKANHSYNRVYKRPHYIPHPDTLNLINITLNQDPIHNGWALMGSTCAGCASYYYKILRSKKQLKGEDDVYYYYYYFYFYSNSHLSNGTPAGTYLSDVNFFIDNEFIFAAQYILLDIGQVVYGAWMRSQNPQALVLFKPTKVTVY